MFQNCKNTAITYSDFMVLWLIAVSLVKTIGSEPDVTEICTNSTLSIITIIVCKIRTERNRPAVCRLLYQYGKDFEHQCDSRFKLILENQTVFLQLTGLTPVDSGNHSCECSHPDGTFIQHLKVTVEGKHILLIFPHSYSPLCWHCIAFLLMRWQCVGWISCYSCILQSCKDSFIIFDPFYSNLQIPVVQYIMLLSHSFLHK